MLHVYHEGCSFRATRLGLPQGRTTWLAQQALALPRWDLTLWRGPLVASMALEIMFAVAKPVPCAREDELRAPSLRAISARCRLRLQLSLPLQNSHKECTCSTGICEDWVSPAQWLAPRKGSGCLNSNLGHSGYRQAERSQCVLLLRRLLADTVSIRHFPLVTNDCAPNNLIRNLHGYGKQGFRGF